MLALPNPKCSKKYINSGRNINIVIIPLPSGPKFLATKIVNNKYTTALDIFAVKFIHTLEIILILFESIIISKR